MGADLAACGTQKEVTYADIEALHERVVGEIIDGELVASRRRRLPYGCQAVAQCPHGRLAFVVTSRWPQTSPPASHRLQHLFDQSQRPSKAQKRRRGQEMPGFTRKTKLHKRTLRVR